MDAEAIVDVIAWTKAFETFCVSNSGNRDVDVEAAEKALLSTKMKGIDTPDYVKRFKKAVEDALVCGSTMTNDRIVALFFRNLNTHEDVFHRFDTLYLSPLHPMNKFLSAPLQNAVDYVNDYHKSTVLPVAARKKEIESTTDTHSNNNSNHPINTVSDLAKLMNSRSKKKNDQVVVTHQVLATFLKNSAVPDNDKKGPSKSKKRSISEEPAATVADVPDDRKKIKVEKKACYRFKAPGGCKFGSDCRYSPV